MGAKILLLSSFLFFGTESLSATGHPAPASIPVVSGVFQGQRSLDRFTAVRGLFSSGSFQDGIVRTTTGRLDTIDVLTEILDENWDTESSAWTNAMDVVILYDAQAREVERTTSISMFNNVWMPQTKLLRYYDGSGRLTRIVSRIWNGAMWQNNARDTIVYGPSGLPIEELVEIFNGAGWDPYQKYVVAYDGNQRPVEIIGNQWGGSAWVNSFRYAMSYDGEGRQTEFLNQSWVGSAWENNLRTAYAYDVNGSRTSETDQFWSGGTWNDDTRYLWTFDDSQFLVEEIYQKWSGSAWVNDTRQAYTNGAGGDPEEILVQYWGGSTWEDDKISYITYDGVKVVEQYILAWSGSAWVNNHKTSFSWGQIVTSGEITQQYPVNDKWNMVSVPLDVADHAKTAVFPAAVSNAFAFDAGYVAAPTLENGKGYWLKFDGAQNVSVTGVQITADTFDVSAGWNMVGSIGVPVAASSVGSIPGGVVSSNFFEFDNGYVNAPTIEPGKGYWVKIAQSGKLVLNGAGNTPVASRLRMEIIGEQPPAPPDDVPAAETAPVQYGLEQNYPNPFNPVTTIRYSAPTAGRVVITVYNALGQEVAVLLDGVREAGVNAVSFDAGRLPSGVYTYRISAGSFTESRKMMLVK